jgi:hypothetical protein
MLHYEVVLYYYIKNNVQVLQVEFKKEKEFAAWNKNPTGKMKWGKHVFKRGQMILLNS